MIDMVIWYVWVQVFAFCGFLITSSWLRPLPDRGYGLSKAFGVLFGGFFYWIIVTLGFGHNDSGSILLAIVLMATIGLILKWRSGQSKIKENAPVTGNAITMVVTVEALFLVAFVLCALYRAYNPEIVEAGGEKYMESMYINAILRSPTFPPNDAWLSGFSISYYYFGYILIAMLTKISGVQPGIGFNLGGAHFFAMTITSAFSVGYNLWEAYCSKVNILKMRLRSGIVAGLLTACMLGIMGNMGGLMESIRCTNILPMSFWKWLDVRSLDTKPVECISIIPTRFYWWWDWSRVIHDYTPLGTDQEVITEMPSFSFVLGDNHPHVMSLPFVLLTVSIAIYYATRPGRKAYDTSTTKIALDGRPVALWLLDNVPDILLTAVVLGGLSFMNTWDFPVYGAVVIGAIFLRRWIDGHALIPAGILGALFVATSYVLYLPFYSTFASQARGIGVNFFNGTRWIQFVLMFAPLLLTSLCLILIAIAKKTVRGKNGISVANLLKTAFSLIAAGFVVGLFATVMIAAISPTVRGYISEFSASGNIMGVTRDTIIARLIGRVSDPWVALFLSLCAGFAATLILARTKAEAIDPDHSQVMERFVMLLVLGGSLLTLAVEFVFLQDLFGTRMNTVFKFYYQTWTVWSVAGAFTMMMMFNNARLLSRIGVGLISVLILAGMLFPLYAAYTKAGGFAGTPTLDGSAYLLQSHAEDARIIQWMNTNITGAPTIVEAPGDHFGAYQYFGRISAFTGLPTLLGWGGHEHQWRGNYDEPSRREPLIESLYNTTDSVTANKILKQFDVKYVIVGGLESTRYSQAGLSKFKSMCNAVFQSGASTVYQCE